MSSQLPGRVAISDLAVDDLCNLSPEHSSVAQPPSSEDEWHERFAGLVNPLLTDVFQERNGIYSFDRRAKFDVTRIRMIQGRPAAFELQPRLTA